MEAVTGGLTVEAMAILGLTVLLSAALSFAAASYWFRREHRRMQKKIIEAITKGSFEPDDLPFLTGREARDCGELVAQFKVNQGRQVVSVLEAEGRRFVHVDGELTAPQRARMMRYLKSEGFVS